MVVEKNEYGGTISDFYRDKSDYSMLTSAVESLMDRDSRRVSVVPE